MRTITPRGELVRGTGGFGIGQGDGTPHGTGAGTPHGPPPPSVTVVETVIEVPAPVVDEYPGFVLQATGRGARASLVLDGSSIPGKSSLSEARPEPQRSIKASTKRKNFMVLEIGRAHV